MSQISTVQRSQLRPRVQEWLNTQLKNDMLFWLEQHRSDRKVTLQHTISGELDGLQLQLHISGAVNSEFMRDSGRTWMSEVCGAYKQEIVPAKPRQEVVSDGLPATPSQIFRWTLKLKGKGWAVSLLFSASQHGASAWINATICRPSVSY